VIACTHPQLFDMPVMPVEVICEGEASGQTIRSEQPDRPAIRACMGVDAAAVKQLFLDRLALLH
jgi:inosine-uridine nucleoside N-ribohydrolase